MATTVTNVSIAAMNTATAAAGTAATSTTNAEAEVFTITPTKGVDKMLVVIHLVGEATAATIAWSFAAGDFWAGAAISGTAAEKTSTAIEVETAKVMQDDGTIALTLTPGASDSLATVHGAYVQVFELL